jgi:hypothetical protein
MRDHVRILGTLFMAWGVAQFVALIAFAAGWRMNAPQTRVPGLAWVLTLLGGAIYLWIGRSLRQRDLRIRTPAILLSILALLSFPVGTVIGAYGLWVFFSRKELTAS